MQHPAAYPAMLADRLFHQRPLGRRQYDCRLGHVLAGLAFALGVRWLDAPHPGLAPSRARRRAARCRTLSTSGNTPGRTSGVSLLFEPAAPARAKSALAGAAGSVVVTSPPAHTPPSSGRTQE